MSGAIHSELSLFWYAIGIGAVAALHYDLLLLLRRIIKHKAGVIWLEDLLFWLFWSVLVFIVLYKTNYGMMRWYVLLGILLGVYFFQRLIGCRLIRIMSTCINRLISITLKKKEVDDSL